MKECSLIEKYSSKFLPEVRQAIKALDHRARLAIVSVLEEHEELSFSELKELLKLSNSDLYYHLQCLMKAGILKSYYKEKIDISPYTSYYKLTEFGKSFIASLSSALIPSSLRSKLRSEKEVIWQAIGQPQPLELLTKLINHREAHYELRESIRRNFSLSNII